MRFDMEPSRIPNLKYPEQIHGKSVLGVIISAWSYFYLRLALWAENMDR
jgi:hypothetical protein